jgi:hypothetical protein
MKCNATDGQILARAVDAVRNALASYQTPKGIRLGSAAWLISAGR